MKGLLERTRRRVPLPPEKAPWRALRRQRQGSFKDRSNLFRGVLSAALVLITSGTLARADAFLGAIPVQYVGPNEELVLDMHRFYQADGAQKLDVRGNDDVEVAWNESAFQLRVRPKKKGLFDVPIV